MLMLKLAGYGCLGLSGVALIYGIGEELPGMVAAAFGGAVAGVLLLGLDRIVQLLADIRDATAQVVPQPETPETANTQTPRSLQEIEADLVRIRAR